MKNLFQMSSRLKFCLKRIKNNIKRILEPTKFDKVPVIITAITETPHPKFRGFLKICYSHCITGENTCEHKIFQVPLAVDFNATDN